MILETLCSIEFFGIKLILVLVSGLSKLRVGGSVSVCRDFMLKTASTAPAAPNK